MSVKIIITEMTNLNKRIKGINDWIAANPHITDPNAYEIMDCNVSYAELISELRKAHTEECGVIDIPVKVLPAELVAKDEQTGVESYVVVPPKIKEGIVLTTIYPEAAEVLHGLQTMEARRNLSYHPFFTKPEVKAMYDQVKRCQEYASYQVPEDDAVKSVKKELLCECVSVPFYVWQVQRTEPDYEYDNEVEYEGINQMDALYQSDEVPAQFTTAISNLKTLITSSYKYREEATKGSNQK